MNMRIGYQVDTTEYLNNRRDRPSQGDREKTSDCRHQNYYVSYSFYVNFVTLLGTRVRKRQN